MDYYDVSFEINTETYMNFNNAWMHPIWTEALMKSEDVELFSLVIATFPDCNKRPLALSPNEFPKKLSLNKSPSLTPAKWHIAKDGKICFLTQAFHSLTSYDCAIEPMLEQSN